MAQLRLDYHRMERLVEQVGTRELEEFEVKQEPVLQDTVEQATQPPSAVMSAVATPNNPALSTLTVPKTETKEVVGPWCVI